MTLEVSLQALEYDARLWDGTSSTLATAGSAAAGLTLSMAQLSWAADVVGLDTYYETARARAQQLLGEGSEQTALIASTLRQVKTDYETTDANAQARLSKLWTPTP